VVQFLGSIIAESSSVSNVLQSHSEDFVAAQYQALSDSFWRYEESGERRVTSMVALVAAVIAAFVALAEVENLGLEALFLPSILAVMA
jgi:hypothetical protein